MKLVSASLGLSLLALSLGTVASAESLLEGKERYATFFLGATQAEDYDFLTTLGGGLGTITTDTGVSVGVILGARLSPTLRSELELSYSASDTSQIQFVGFPSNNYDGSIDAVFGLVNLWYDMPVQGKFKPYVGGGLGLGHVSQAASAIPTGALFVDDSDTVFAGQIGFGLRHEIHSNGVLDIGYRYKMTSDLDFTTTIAVSPPHLVNGNYASHAISVGYSFSF